MLVSSGEGVCKNLLTSKNTEIKRDATRFMSISFVDTVKVFRNRIDLIYCISWCAFIWENCKKYLRCKSKKELVQRIYSLPFILFAKHMYAIPRCYRWTARTCVLTERFSVSSFSLSCKLNLFWVLRSHSHNIDCCRRVQVISSATFVK